MLNHESQEEEIYKEVKCLSETFYKICVTVNYEKEKTLIYKIQEILNIIGLKIGLSKVSKIYRIWFKCAKDYDGIHKYLRITDIDDLLNCF